jgi:hypothetical protein
LIPHLSTSRVFDLFQPTPPFYGNASVEIETQGTATKTTEVIADRIHDICRAKGYFGEFFRRMRAKLGTAQAITATTHKIARILYHVLSTKEPFTETIFHHLYDEQAHQRAEIRLRKRTCSSLRNSERRRFKFPKSNSVIRRSSVTFTACSDGCWFWSTLL